MLIYNDNLTIDGYSQPGFSANTKPITQANPAVFADAATISYYNVSYLGGDGQTSPFATSATVLP